MLINLKLLLVLPKACIRDKIAAVAVEALSPLSSTRDDNLCTKLDPRSYLHTDKVPRRDIVTTWESTNSTLISLAQSSSSSPIAYLLQLTVVIREFV